jgi:UDP-N-acetylglucosamine 2-epimerase
MRTLTIVKILHVVGARPNFMKIAPIIAQLKKRPGVTQVLVHTGQHYDTKMSDVFFRIWACPRRTCTSASAASRTRRCSPR